MGLGVSGTNKMVLWSRDTLLKRKPKADALLLAIQKASSLTSRLTKHIATRITGIEASWGFEDNVARLPKRRR